MGGSTSEVWPGYPTSACLTHASLPNAPNWSMRLRQSSSQIWWLDRLNLSKQMLRNEDKLAIPS